MWQPCRQSLAESWWQGLQIGLLLSGHFTFPKLAQMWVHPMVKGRG